MSIICFSDSNYEGNSVIRRNVSGFVLYVLGVPVARQPKAQRSVNLLSPDAEWVVLSKVVEELIFVIQLLQRMEMSVKLPVMERVDTLVAYFLASNVTTTSHTKHVQICE